MSFTFTKLLESNLKIFDGLESRRLILRQADAWISRVDWQWWHVPWSAPGSPGVCPRGAREEPSCAAGAGPRPAVAAGGTGAAGAASVCDDVLDDVESSSHLRNDVVAVRLRRLAVGIRRSACTMLHRFGLEINCNVLETTILLACSNGTF